MLLRSLMVPVSVDRLVLLSELVERSVLLRSALRSVLLLLLVSVLLGLALRSVLELLLLLLGLALRSAALWLLVSPVRELDDVLEPVIPVLLLMLPAQLASTSVPFQVLLDMLLSALSVLFCVAVVSVC